MDIIFGDEDHVGPQGRNTSSFKPTNCCWNTDSFGSTKHSRCRSIDTFSFTELHDRTSTTRTKAHQNASIYRRLGSNEKNGKMNFSLVSDISASQILWIALMLFTCSSHLRSRTKARAESLKSVPKSSSAELLYEYEKIIAKLNNHFIPMVNPDCACSKLEKICQKEGESVAQYHMRLQLQVAKCGFSDPDEVNRSKIPPQTLRHKKLCREAMVKRYTLQQLLEHAVNKEDTDCQAQDMEQKLALVQDRVNRIHQKKTQKPKHKHKPKPLHDDKKESVCQILWYGPQRAKIKLPCLWKNRWPKRTRKTLHRNHGQPQSMSRKSNCRSHRISPSRLPVTGYLHSHKENLYPLSDVLMPKSKALALEVEP